MVKAAFREICSVTFVRKARKLLTLNFNSMVLLTGVLNRAGKMHRDFNDPRILNQCDQIDFQLRGWMQGHVLS